MAAALTPEVAAAHPVTNCDPPVEKLPLPRPILMGGEEKMRAAVKNASLPAQLKEALCAEGVHMAEPEHVLGILQKMVRDGLDRFQVVTDFDQTLTRFHRDGQFSHSCYSIISRSPRTSDQFRSDSLKLHDHYVEIELDPTVPFEKKIPHMEEWWLKQHDLFLQLGFQESWIKEMVRESTVEFRDRTDEFFQKLDNFRVPLLIYSAGIDNLISGVLSERSNIKSTSLEPLIVANSMVFDEKGLLKGFREELIHSFNKNEIFPHHRDYFEKHSSRRNVLLMGDMIGDLAMADGMRAKENVITIGFLNTKIHSSFSLYSSSFDIVLIDDQSLNLPIAIVDAIGSSR
ncbi:7-methylguanosine phosphate-specific 5'-nucleotidase A-like isoform X2 [Paramacrobiotus metropolitanus]|nr:7-methylguanosine phosphate-specific 5'-nucleotidase A-like isoform X2 [Paramacrobiotus metropolitanus]XP_055339504.1 7-methylguanosine phosphate-specific 5'-nucleotidase A-like isoform X2 [Paramacrobiotus metropolitanus]